MPPLLRLTPPRGSASNVIRLPHAALQQQWRCVASAAAAGNIYPRGETGMIKPRRPATSSQQTRGLGNSFTLRLQHQARQLSSSPTRTLSTTTATPPNMYTTSFAFFEALWDAGVTHCFVNLGSDHPSIIEAMVKGAREKKDRFPRIITCPNEVCPSPESVTPKT